jgi:hypothetical protein
MLYGIIQYPIAKPVINRQDSVTSTMDNLRETIMKMISECKDERDVDCRAQILYQINSMLPNSRKLRVPSLITNDYINMALYRIEESLLMSA